MESLSQYNNGYKYILCVIDVFSKYAFCVPLRDKTGPTILSAMKNIISESKRSPTKIWCDRGSEFYNKEFQRWAKSKNITIYSTYGESKSVVVERFIRTLKELITRKFTQTNSRDWVKILPSVLKFYNHKFHSTIQMSPTEASDPSNEPIIFARMYMSNPEKPKKKKPRFKVNDQVRISRTKNVFEKGYEPNFSYEVFTVSEVLNTDPVTYKLVDYNGDPIAGSFYTEEMIKTKVPDHSEIEKILETRKVGKKKEYLVRFYGWPKKFDEWLPESQIKNL